MSSTRLSDASQSLRKQLGKPQSGRPKLTVESLESRLLLTADLSLEPIEGPTGDLSTTELGRPTPPEYPSIFEPVAALPNDIDLEGSSPKDVIDPVQGRASAQGLNFTGTDYTQSFFIPPDTHGAVGPSHIVELINGSYAVFDKATGAELDRSSLNQFWTDSGLSAGGTFDPRVDYDMSTGRFYAVAVNNARADNEFLFAISQTNNPLDGWLGFSVDSDSDNGERWADYPQLSYDADSIHIGANMFDQTGGGLFSPTRTTLVLSKADLLDAFPDISDRTLIEDHESITGFSAQGVVYNPDPTGGLPSIFFSQFNSNTVRLSTLSGPPTAASFSVFTDVALAATSPPDADQLDTSKQDIDTGSSRFSSQVVFRNNSYWAVQGVEDAGDATIRFLQFDTGGNVLQNRTFGTGGDLDLYFPSIAVNDFGDVVIGFSYSSSSLHPSAGYFTGTTTAGVTTFQTTPFNGSAFGSAGYERIDSVGRNRWGDYSHTVVDPSDPNTFWTFQEFASAEDIWSTRITEIRVRSPELSGSSFNVVTEPLTPGATTDITYSVTNQGDGDASGFWVDFFLSSNENISTLDSLLGIQFFGSLAAGASTGVLTETVTLPDYDDPIWDNFNSDGTYTIGMIVDRFDSQLESNENNNSNTAEFFDFDNLLIELPVPSSLTAAEGFAVFHNTGESNDTVNFNAFLDFSGDVDSYYFAGDSLWGGTYTITVGDFGNAIDPVAAVYDALTGQMIAFADDLSDTVDDSQIIATLNGWQRYIVVVADKEGDSTGELEINIVASDSTTPTNIPVDGNGDGSDFDFIDTPEDTDFYQFTAPANATGSLDVTVNPDIALEAGMVLFDAAGNEVARDLVGLAGVNANVGIVGVVPGETYFLSVLSQRYATQGSFDVFVDFSTSALLGDFDVDGAYTCNDIDMLTMELATGGGNLAFDLNSDFAIDQNDLDVWLATAATFNGFASPYIYGDANLDGFVNGGDFVVWNNNKFTANSAWCSGDFNFDGFVNGLDFVIWNSNKFTSSDTSSLINPTRLPTETRTDDKVAAWESFDRDNEAETPWTEANLYHDRMALRDRFDMSSPVRQEPSDVDESSHEIDEVFATLRAFA